MAFAPIYDGPILKYLAATGKSRDQFDAALRADDPAAAAIFAAEVLYGAISNLTAAVENGPLQPPDGK